MRQPLTAILLAAIGTAAFAEPAGVVASRPARPAKAIQPQSTAAPIVLASVEGAGTSAAAEAAQSAPRTQRRVARVTTCRCGDPQASADPDSQ